MLGLHQHGPVAQIDRRLYAECYRCGSDLIRKGRRWRRARPEELPVSWKAQTPPTMALSMPLAIVLTTIVLASAVFYMGLL